MPVIEVANLHKRHGGTVAVDDVSFTVEAGEIFGILGRHGAGKSTTVECVVGLRRPDAGTVRVFGLDPYRHHQLLAQRVGVQLQAGALRDRLRVGEAISRYASLYDDPADPGELLELFGLTAHRHTAYRDLSGGQQRRLSIALALVGNPQLVVLDDLTTGLDPRARRDIWELIGEIRERGVTILLVTQLMEEAGRLCDRLALIHAGQVVATDTPQGLIRRAGSDRSLASLATARLSGGE